MKNIIVYCGSTYGKQQAYQDAATLLGQRIAQRQAKLVYGGAQVGLMGLVADAVLEGGGDVIGVLPKFLSRKEIAHPKLPQLIIVETMHERKAKMLELGDAIIALPGGYGTLEELFEALTWAQLKQIQKPIGILNINGYYDKLIELLQDMCANGLLRKANLDLFIVSNDVDDLLEKMKAF